jgi:hypothetical protein
MRIKDDGFVFSSEEKNFFSTMLIDNGIEELLRTSIFYQPPEKDIPKIITVNENRKLFNLFEACLVETFQMQKYPAYVHSNAFKAAFSTAPDFTSVREVYEKYKVLVEYFISLYKSAKGLE